MISLNIIILNLNSFLDNLLNQSILRLYNSSIILEKSRWSGHQWSGLKTHISIGNSVRILDTCAIFFMEDLHIYSGPKSWAKNGHFPGKPIYFVKSVNGVLLLLSSCECKRYNALLDWTSEYQWRKETWNFFIQ